MADAPLNCEDAPLSKPSLTSIYRWLYAHLRLVDIFDLIANLALVFIAVESVNRVGDIFKLPKLILYPAGAYFVVTILRFAFTFYFRRARDYEQRESVCQVFHWLYEKMFEHEPGTSGLRPRN